MFKKFPLLLLLVLGSPLSRAQEVRKLADNIFWEQLSNGLEVLVVEDHSVPLVTLDITFKAGAIIGLYGEY